MNGCEESQGVTRYRGGRYIAIALVWSMVFVGANLIIMSTGCEYESSLDGVQCSDDDQCPERSQCSDGYCVRLPPPDRIDLSPDQPWTISVGEGLELTAAVLDTEGEWIRTSDEISWSVSAADELISIDAEQGNMITVTGEEPGQALLHVEAFNLRKTATVAVSDIAVSRVVIDEQDGLEVSDIADWTIVEGDEVALEAIIYGESGSEEVQLEDRVVRWSSSNPAALKVDSDGVVEARRAPDSPVEITAEAGPGAEPITQTVSFEVRDRQVDRVAIIPSAIELAAGQSVAVSAQAYAEDGRRLKREVEEFDWHSDDAATVAVEVDDEHDAIWIEAQPLVDDELGRATITAAINGEEGQLDVRVVEALDDGVNISPQHMELMEGQEATFYSTVIDDGVVRPHRDVEWAIDDDGGVLEFVGEQSVGTEQKVRALRSGSATVTAEDLSAGLDAGQATIDVAPAPAFRVSTDPSYVELIVDHEAPRDVDVQVITRAGDILDADTMDQRGGELTFSVADDELVDVELDGVTVMVSAFGLVGTTTLDIVYSEEDANGDEYQVETRVGVFVVAQPVMSVAIEESDLSLEPVDGETLHADVQYDGDPPEEECQRRWISDAPSVASVHKRSTDQAELIAYAEGTATITLQCGARSDTLDVTVTGEEPDEFVVTPDNGPTIIESARPVRFEVEALFDDGSSRACPISSHWSSDQTDVVVVGSDGKVAAVADESGATATVTGSCGAENASVEVEVATAPDAVTIECGDHCEDIDDDDVDHELEIHPQDGQLVVAATYGGEPFHRCNAVWFSDNEDLVIEEDGRMNDENDDSSGQTATITVVCAGVVATVDIITEIEPG